MMQTEETLKEGENQLLIRIVVVDVFVVVVVDICVVHALPNPEKTNKSDWWLLLFLKVVAGGSWFLLLLRFLLDTEIYGVGGFC